MGRQEIKLKHLDIDTFNEVLGRINGDEAFKATLNSDEQAVLWEVNEHGTSVLQPSGVLMMLAVAFRFDESVERKMTTTILTDEPETVKYRVERYDTIKATQEVSVLASVPEAARANVAIEMAEDDRTRTETRTSRTIASPSNAMRRETR